MTFCWANILILLRTVSIPRSLDAFSSSTASLNALPKSILASANMVVVLPTPGGPYIDYNPNLILDTVQKYITLRIHFFGKLTAIIILGTLPLVENLANRKTVSSFPIMSKNVLGRYFSILKTCMNYSYKQIISIFRLNVYKPRCI